MAREVRTAGRRFPSIGPHAERFELELAFAGVTMSAFGRRLHSLTIVTVALTGGPAHAQDLDRGKSGAQLFATNCVACHHSPNGLAQDSFSWTLSSFLQQHYTDGPASAQVLTAYLQSIDAHRAKPQPAVHNWLAPRNSLSAAPPRPPAPVPVR